LVVVVVLFAGFLLFYVKSFPFWTRSRDREDFSFEAEETKAREAKT